MRNLRGTLTSALVALTLVAPVFADPSTAGAAVDDWSAEGPIENYEADLQPRSVILRFKDGTATSTVNKVVSAHGMKRKERLNAAKADVYEVPVGKNTAAVIAALRDEPSVRIAEPDYDLVQDAISSDDRVNSFWGLENTGQSVNGQTGIVNVDVNAPGAWGRSTGSNVVVAVLDEGVDIAHPEFAGRIWQNDDCNNDGLDSDKNGYVDDCNGWDFYHGDKSVFDSADGDDHGTHVAGTIAANVNNGVGGAGVAPNVKIMPLKFLGPDGGSTSDAITAIAYAKANGAKIVNCSWGGGAYSQALRDAMQNSGLLFATAAGNDGVNLNSSAQYPAQYGITNQITVAAIDNRGNLASFSNRGGNTALGAPGVNILSTMPRKRPVAVALDRTAPNDKFKTGYWGFGLEAVKGASTRRDLLRGELVRLGASALNSPILLVDDDESISGLSSTPDTASYYLTALVAAGYTNVTVREVAKDAPGPTSAEMSGRTVIWATGYALGTNAATTLHIDDLEQIAVYLEAGGRLLLAGADAIYRNEAAALIRDDMGIKFVAEGDVRTSAFGAGIYNGMTVTIDGSESPKGARNPYQDSVEPWNLETVATLQLSSDADFSAAYGYKNGTSMAAPHVAGVAALVAAMLPSYSANGVADVVRSTVVPLASLQNGNTTKGGMVDAAAATAKAASLASGTPAPVVTPVTTPLAKKASGYRFVAADGGIFNFGDAPFKGSAGNERLRSPIVGMSPTRSGQGYWMVGADGSVRTYGDAQFFGAANSSPLNRPIVGMAGTPSGNGYWLVASDGGIFSYGDARFLGSTGDINLNKPIVGIASAPDGNGYWLIASDGGIFTFGSARFLGSTGAMTLNKPIVGGGSTPSGNGYWLVASDGGIFTFGDAGFYGSTGDINLNKPIVGMSATPTGTGYWLVASDGGIFSFGDAPFFGSTGATRLNSPIVSMSR